jgi:YHS domain-containing protein
MTLHSETPPEVEPEIALEIDPVCGMTIDPDIASELDLGVTFAEREYLFCGPPCRASFLRSPLAYAAAGRDAP